MQVEIVSKDLSRELEAEIWQFFDKQPFRTVFQSPDFYHFYRSVPYYNPTYFITKDKDGQIIGLLLVVLIQEGNGLMGLLSKRCLVHGGPMAENDNPEIIGLLISHLNKVMKSQAVYTQFRNFRLWPAEVQLVFEANGFTLHDRLNSIIELNPEKIDDFIVRIEIQGNYDDFFRILSEYHIKNISADDQNLEQIFLDYQSVGDLGKVHYINPGNPVFDSLVKVVRNQFRDRLQLQHQKISLHKMKRLRQEGGLKSDLL